MTNEPLDIDIDVDALMTFFGTLTSLELAKVNELGLSLEDFDDAAGMGEIAEMFSTLTAVAAHRLGHQDITADDMASLSLSTQSTILRKAAKTSATVNQRTRDLLASLSGEAARP